MNSKLFLFEDDISFIIGSRSGSRSGSGSGSGSRSRSGSGSTKDFSNASGSKKNFRNGGKVEAEALKFCIGIQRGSGSGSEKIFNMEVEAEAVQKFCASTSLVLTA